MQATGNKPPGNVPAKAKYLISDIAMCNQYFGVSVKTPSAFPINTLNAQRLLTALTEETVKKKCFGNTFPIYFF